MFSILAFPPGELYCLFQCPSWSWHVYKLLPPWVEQSPASAAWLPQHGAGLLGCCASSSPSFPFHQLEEKRLCQLLVL